MSSDAPRFARPNQSRSRMLALGLAAALTAPLGLVASPAAAVIVHVEVPTPAGSWVGVNADLGGVTMSVLYSQLDTPADTYFMRQDLDDDPFGLPFPVGEPVGFFETGFWAAIAETETVEVCLDLSSVIVDDRVPVLYRTDYDSGTSWVEADRSAASTTTRPCTTYPPEHGSQALLVMLQDRPADPADVDVQVVRVFDPLALGLGDGEQNGVYLDVTVTNSGPVEFRLGLGADLRVDDVDEKLWLDETWGLPEDSGIGSFFALTVAPGDSVTMQVPDWPGKTYTFWLIDESDIAQSVIVGTYETGGTFSLVDIDIDNNIVQIGSVAEFAGSSVFPGVTTTIEASGLIPGESYELWLTPGVDYFTFMLLGGLLADLAVQVGVATVDGTGLLATTFTVPTSVAVGDRYQLMIGDPDTRSWPAGTIEQLEIVAPDGGGTVDGPAAAQLEVSIPIGAVEVLFSFPAGTTDGQTTASVSTTGPAAVGFTIPGTPPTYLHLSTTATFSGPVEVCVGVEASVDPTSLRLYHYALGSAGYEWVDITTRYETDAVCGETESFSPFALGIADGVRLTSKEQCKNGGWATSTLPEFRNQGHCVMHFARLR